MRRPHIDRYHWTLPCGLGLSGESAGSHHAVALANNSKDDACIVTSVALIAGALRRLLGVFQLARAAMPYHQQSGLVASSLALSPTRNCTGKCVFALERAALAVWLTTCCMFT